MSKFCVVVCVLSENGAIHTHIESHTNRYAIHNQQKGVAINMKFQNYTFCSKKPTNVAKALVANLFQNIDIILLNVSFSFSLSLLNTFPCTASIPKILFFC